MADQDMQHRIELMIEAEADSRERARLMILFEIVRVLTDNVRAQRETMVQFSAHRKEFEAHVEIETALFNRGIGMWKVMAWVLAVAQSLVIFVGADHIASDRQRDDQVAQHAKELEILKEIRRQQERFPRSEP